MDRKKMSIREKLQLMKEIDKRNKKRIEEFKKQKERNEMLFDMYMEGTITEEEFYRQYKK